MSDTTFDDLEPIPDEERIATWERELAESADLDYGEDIHAMVRMLRRLKDENTRHEADEAKFAYDSGKFAGGLMNRIEALERENAELKDRNKELANDLVAEQFRYAHTIAAYRAAGREYRAAVDAVDAQGGLSPWNADRLYKAKGVLDAMLNSDFGGEEP